MPVPCGNVMRIKLLFLALAFLFVGYFYCSSPTNPLTDYKNCSIAFISPERNDSTYFTSDTAFFRIKVTLPSLFNVLMLSVDNSKDTSTVYAFKNGTQDTVTIKKIFPNADTVMVRIKAILQNKSELFDSIRIVIVDKPSVKTVFWHFKTHRDTVYEGDSIDLRVDTFYTVPANDTASLKMLLTLKEADFLGDSVFVFHAAMRDSGTYPIPVVVSTKTASDTASISFVVKPRYCTLSLQADSGSIVVNPLLAKYRLGDTLSLKAVPNAGFLFVQWTGDASGNDTLVKVIVMKNMSVKAVFIAKTSSECMQISSGSINNAIREASPGGSRPKTICPAEGTYDQGTIKIWGKVRIQLQ